MEKTNFYIIILFYFICGISVAFGIGGILSGNGTQSDPYLIEDYSDFQTYRANSSFWSSNVYTKLMCDIDLAPTLPNRYTYKYAVIARDTSTSSGFQGTAFSGSFDGNRHVISNLTIDTAGENNEFLGLFGQLNSGSAIINITLENVSITGGTQSCYIGGLCGFNYGTLSNCNATGLLKGFGYLGGLCGSLEKGTISNCHASGFLIGNVAPHHFGGLCGRNREGRISNSYANTTITGGIESKCLGGLCGGNYHYGLIRDCYAIGSVNGGNDSTLLGGLVGRIADSSDIYDCYATVSVSGGDDSSLLGGSCGYIDDGSIKNSYATGDVSGGNNSSSLGGLCGSVSGWGVVINCYSSGSVTGAEYVGGFCGYNLYSTYMNCFWDIETSGTTLGVGYVSDKNVVGKTTSQMHQQSTYSDANWVFADFQIGLRGWYMPDNGYPQIDWQNPNASYVPDVTNMSLSQAKLKLNEMNLTLGKDIYVKSWKTPINTVAGISVHAGGYVDKMLPIDMFVSSGSDGNGTEANPYEIAGNYDLDSINTALSSHYIMTADIYLSHNTNYYKAVIAPALRYYPFGSTFYDIPFSGYFEGNNHIISNLNISASEVSHIALFGYIGKDGTVANLGIKNSSSYIYNGHSLVSILCGQNDGEIKNCHIIKSVIKGNGSMFGGLCACNSGSIINSYVSDMTTEPSQSVYIGLLCGFNYKGVIKDCYSVGLVNDKRASSYIGGLCGQLRYGAISNCYSAYKVIKDNQTQYIGGICGRYIDGTFNRCFWDAEISGINKGVGNLDEDPNDLVGKTTLQLQTLSTFTDANWDFVGESNNGYNDIWRMCVDGVNYPRLSWEYAQNGDFACGDGTDLLDLQVLAEHWLFNTESDPINFSYACDANGDEVIDMADFEVLAGYWMEN